MNEEDVLLEVIAKLDALTITYALTGGLAVSFYGKPRSTHDFDLIIQIAPGVKKIKQLLAQFNRDFYSSEEAVIDALLHHTMFNLIHHETGLKIDFWVLKDDEYNQTAFKRKRKHKLIGTNIYLLSPEDMIINKLLWYKASEVYKHFDDAKGIWEFQKGKLNPRYLRKWANKLDILKPLNEVLGD